jgi:squalene-hopene/tetraprenyl-beta-curcumene cyclase
MQRDRETLMQKSVCSVLLLTLLASAAISLTAAPPAPGWNAKAAATYLDGRVEWWSTWRGAARDHDTFCISCHTALPYALGRPALRQALGEKETSTTERKILENVAARVRLWQETEPYYPDRPNDPKKRESRGTESILNALILASYAAPDWRLALDNMWAEQTPPGAWPWLQFHNAPWEGDSDFFGATLAAIAVGTAPDHYRDTPAIQDRLARLKVYLVRERASQKLVDRVMLLWASAKLPNLLTPAEQRAIADEATSKQRADGGFSLTNFIGEWRRRDDTPLETASDGYATALVSVALQESGAVRDRASLTKATTWLAAHQESADGRWLAYSLNKQRDLTSDAGRFMADAATAYAVIALTHK